MIKHAYISYNVQLLTLTVPWANCVGSVVSAKVPKPIESATNFLFIGVVFIQQIVLVLILLDCGIHLLYTTKLSSSKPLYWFYRVAIVYALYS